MNGAVAVPAPVPTAASPNLDRLTRPQVLRLNRLQQPRRPLDFQIGTQTFTLERAFGPGSAMLGEQVAIGLRLDGSPGRLIAGAAAIRALLGAVEGGIELDPLPPSDLMALLLETAVGDLLDRLERELALPLILEPTVSTEAATMLPCLLRRGSDAWPLGIAADDAMLERLLAAWPAARRPLDDLPLPAVLRFGITRLAAGLLASLVVGDVILAETGGIAGRATLVIGERWTAPVLRRQGICQLEQAPRTPADGLPHEGRWTMQDKSRDADAMATASDEIPIQVSFELGRQDIPLGQLRSLGPGMVLDLAQLPDELVEIRANGRSVGRGTLVEIDGRIGVRIVRIFQHG